MDLKDYFETTRGFGMLATADSSGAVDVAVYARPHIMDDGTIAFVMADRLMHQNIQSNPHAAYLFVEEGEGYQGTRLYLTKMREEENAELADQLSRRKYKEEAKRRYVVYFRLDRELPVIGQGT
jgi:hypothetical protein